METLEFYVVRSKDGKYLRAKGFSGSGNSWVEELKRAKVYTKKGTACAQITFWARQYPEYGVPDLIPITGTLGEPIPQELRVVNSMRKKEITKLKRELAQAEEDVRKAQKVVENIKSGRIERGLVELEKTYNGIKNKLTELEK
jgi:hypothetical protein